MSIDRLHRLPGRGRLVLCLILISGCAGRAALQPTTRPGIQASVDRLNRDVGVPVETLETADRILASALQTVRSAPTCENLVVAGERYYELGVLDRAASYYSAAVRKGPACATGHDGLARVWRDSGYLPQALTSAHRSTHAGRRLAGPWNTLGTILQELGQLDEARAAYEQAARIDPAAVYALSNLCYLAFLEADVRRGESACLSAIEVDAEYAPARNNLALLYAATGDTSRAFQVFREAAGAAAAHYNLGLVWLARRDFAAALKAFEAAYAEDPSFDAAHARARDVRRLLHSEKHNGDDRRKR